MKRIGLIIVGLVACVNALQAKGLAYYQLKPDATLERQYDAYLASDGMTYYAGDVLYFDEPRRGKYSHYSFVLYGNDFRDYKVGVFGDSTGVFDMSNQRMAINTFYVEYMHNGMPIVVASIGSGNDVIVLEEALRWHEVYKIFRPSIRFYGHVLQGGLLDFAAIARELDYEKEYDDSLSVGYTGTYAGISDCRMALGKGDDHYYSYNYLYILLPARKNSEEVMADYQHVVDFCTNECGRPNKRLNKEGNYFSWWTDGVTTLLVTINDDNEVIVAYQSEFGYKDEQHKKQRQLLVKNLREKDYTEANRIAHHMDSFDYYDPQNDGELTLEDVMAYANHLHTLHPVRKHSKHILIYLSRMLCHMGNEYAQREEYEPAQKCLKTALQIWLYVYGEIPVGLAYKSYEEKVEDFSRQIDEAYPVMSMDYYEYIARLENALPPSTPSNGGFKIRPQKEVRDSVRNKLKGMFL